MNKINIEALELYIATLEQALEKAEIKQQKLMKTLIQKEKHLI